MPAYDGFLTAVKVMATLHPATNAIATAIFDYVPTAHDEAVQRAADRLGARLRELEDRVDEKMVKKNEFADLFKNAYLILQRTQYDEKISAAANILSNACLKDTDPDKLSFNELDHFTRCVESLSIGAIRMIGVLVKQRNKRGDSLDAVCHAFGGIKPDFGLGLVRELNSYNLAYVSESDFKAFDQRSVRVELTKLGDRFYSFALNPQGISATS